MAFTYFRIYKTMHQVYICEQHMTHAIEHCLLLDSITMGVIVTLIKLYR